jgi:hypothetical protein
MTDNKKNESIAKKIVQKRKDDLDFLKALSEFTKLAIEHCEYTIKENKLKQLMPEFDFNIKKYLKQEFGCDGGKKITILELSIFNTKKNITSLLQLYKETTHHAGGNDILSDLHIKINRETIYHDGGDFHDIYEEIKNNTLHIEKCGDISKKNIFTIMHFFEIHSDDNNQDICKIYNQKIEIFGYD